MNSDWVGSRAGFVRPTASLTRRALISALGLAALARRAEAAQLAPLSRVLVEVRPPQKPPGFSFLSANGEKRTLADYRDRGIVLNIWATWCVPCLAEMPALDRLSALVKDVSISVLPVSIDAKGPSAVKAYYAAHRIEHLPILLDPSGDIAAAFKVPGIPASFIFDRKGRLVAHCLGAADWDTPPAIAMIRRLVSGGKEP
ncbi:MAG: TlpA disulfide reductase family protein [Acetobacteraceae bacterium]